MQCNYSDVFQFLPSQSVKALRRIRDFVDKLIYLKTPAEHDFVSSINPDRYITYTDSFASNSDCNDLMTELKTHIDLNTHSDKTSSVWFTNSVTPYTWSTARTGNVTRKMPNVIEPNSVLMQVLTQINNHLGTSLNACLVQYYPNGHSGIRLHDDLEPEMTLNDPIAVLSVGAQRKIDFLHNFQASSEPPAKSLTPEHGSLYVMKSGCQDYFRHRVPADRSCNGCRASFSFRRVVGPTLHDLLVDVPHLSDTGENNVPDGKIIDNDEGTLLVLDRSLRHDPMPSTPSRNVPNGNLNELSNSCGIAPADVTLNADDSVNADFSASTLDQTAPAGNESNEVSLGTVGAEPLPAGVVNAVSTPLTPVQRASVDSGSLDVGVDTGDLNSCSARKTILFGSSMTKHIDQKRLSSPNCKFVNISRSGAQLMPRRIRGNNQSWVYCEMLKNYAASHKADLHEVDRVIFSIGTNDIKYFRDRFGNPGDLRIFIKPIEYLIKLSRQYFGQSVNVYFHSVLPMRCMYTYTPANFEGFNRMLRDICRFNDCYFIDWFNMFLNRPGNDIDLSLYWDNIHLNRVGINMLHDLLNDLLCNHYSSYNNCYDCMNVTR